jgi:acetyl-CoA C-acetyltransferase
MENTYICSYSRTPIGAFQGSLSKIPATTLGSYVIKSVVEKSKINKNLIDEVIMGNVLSANLGQAPARQSSMGADLSNNVECLTINKVCGSGLKAVMLADQSLKLNSSDLIVAGGMESMSLAPHYLQKHRTGMMFGDNKIIDSILKDGLWDPYNKCAMGNCGEVLSKENNYTKEMQNQYAIESYKKSINAIESGAFKDEIVDINIRNKKNDILFNTDEEPLRFNEEKLKKLKPAFDKNGTITAGNASSLSDGAAAVLVCSEDFKVKNNINPIAKIIGHVSFATDPLYFTKAPIYAIEKLLKEINFDIDKVDLFEINEAFSCVVMAAIDELKIEPSKVNINGGAVSMGHPIGASGTRILVTLLNALKTKKLKYGIATLCIGGGEASAMLVEMCN